MKYICKKSSNQEMFAISLSSCSRYNANFKLDQPVFAIQRNFNRNVQCLGAATLQLLFNNLEWWVLLDNW
jgi:hypothetical protein